MIRLADRVITRDATKLQVGQVFYTPWCDEHGKVIDDGTVHRVGEQELRWTAADPQYRWLSQNAAGLDVDHRGRDGGLAALALQGPFSRAVLEAASGEDFADLRYFRRRGTTIAGIAMDVSADRLHGRSRLRAVDPGRRRGRRLGRPVRGRQGVRDPAGGHGRAGRDPPRGRADHAGRGLHLGPPRHEPGAELQPRTRSASASWSASTRRTTSAAARSCRAAKGGPAAGSWA